MSETRKRSNETSGNTATFLLTKQADYLPDGHRVKVVVVGSGYTGVAVAIAILFKRLASELIIIDSNEELAKAEAEDLSHAAAFLGNPKIVGTKVWVTPVPPITVDNQKVDTLQRSAASNYARKVHSMGSDISARDAAVCIITAGIRQEKGQSSTSVLEPNLDIFKVVVPNVCKFAPNSILLVLTSPVDILSYAAMKLSGFPPNRVIGLGTFLDSCRFQYFIAQKLGLSANSVQALIIGENGPTSVPVWSAVAVMGMKLKDINKEIGMRSDPEAWGEIHTKVVECNDDLISRKGYCNWGIGICASEIVDAIVRNTCVCITVSTFVKGCRHGLEKDVFMSLPCVVGRNGVQSYIRHLYTEEEQESTTRSCRSIYEAQKPILDKLE